MTQKISTISKETAEKHGYYLFGGKGDVWSNTAHLSHGGMTTTLCGRPMLSTNWVRINEIQDVGCAECSRLFDLAISL
jgi:hypothetical protein